MNIETIRYYERSGLMPRPPRSPGGHRLYDEQAVQRLLFVRRARDLGFGIAEVRELLALVDGGRYSCEEIKSITTSHLEAVRTKLQDLLRLEHALSRLTDSCKGGSLPECPVIDTLAEFTAPHSASGSDD